MKSTPSLHSRSRRAALVRAGSLALAATPLGARAAIGGLPSAEHDSSSPEWDRLSAQLFPGRRIERERGVVQLLAPLRAAYGASVPVKIISKLAQRPELNVKRLHVVVDKNPSPLAIVLDIGPGLAQADFETRLRVDEYSHVRVVAELSNGELHTDSRYVKTSGGCSAPPNRESLHLIGKTIFKLPAGVTMNSPTPADVTVIHPNDTGFELNNVTVMYIPPHFVRSIKVSYAGQKIFDAELDFSVSENPTLRFNFVPRRAGELRAEVTDSKDGQFVGVLAVA
jgi:sulfur-oxidizing protein SoxY